MEEREYVKSQENERKIRVQVGKKRVEKKKKT